MSYITPEQDIKTILVNKSVAPANQIVLGSRTENFPSDYQIVVRMISSNSNPKWLFDDLTFSFMIIGQNRRDEKLVVDTSWDLFNKMLGSPTTVIGTRSYQQFNGQTMPNFIGYSEDNSKPMYISTMTINRQVQQEEINGNRKPLV